MLLELGDVEAQVLERDGVAAVGLRLHRSGLRQQDDVERAALGPDLDLLLEVARRLELDLVVDLGRDEVVDDRLQDLALCAAPARSGR